MPRGDRTGPLGLGPMTGRAAGYCAGYPVPGYMNPIGGRGMGMARGYPIGGRGMGMARGYRGGGRGRGFGFAAPVVPYGYPAMTGFYPEAVPPAPVPPAAYYSSEGEIESLRAQAAHLGTVLEDIQCRITELEASSSGKETPEKT